MFIGIRSTDGRLGITCHDILANVLTGAVQDHQNTSRQGNIDGWDLGVCIYSSLTSRGFLALGYECTFFTGWLSIT